MRKFLLIGLAFLFFFNANSKAGGGTGPHSYNWISNSSTVWNLAANWSSTDGGTTFPVTGDNVVINTPAIANPVLATTISLANFTIGSKTLTINSGIVLTITGIATFNASTGSSTVTGAGTFTMTGSVSVSQPLTLSLLAQVNMGTSVTPLSSLAIGTTTINGITASCPFYANTSVLTAFYKSTFTNTATIKISNTAATTAFGGNIFSGTTSIEAAGHGLLTLSGTMPSTYNGNTTFLNSSTIGGGLSMGLSTIGSGDTYGLSASASTFTFSNTGTNPISVSPNGSSIFNGNVVFTSGNINFGPNQASIGAITLGTATNPRTVSCSGFLAGTLRLSNIVQAGIATQNLTATAFASGGTGTILIERSGFSGPVNVTAPGVIVNNNTFNNTLTVTQNGNFSTSWIGANTFNGNTSITNSNTGPLYMNSANVNGVADILAAGVTMTFTNTGTGGIYPASAGGPSAFNGNIIVNCTSSNTAANGGNGNGVVFGINGGTSTLGTSTVPKTITIGGSGFNGTLDLTKLTVQGTCSSSAFVFTMTLGKLIFGASTTFNLPLTATAPQILLNGAIFNCAANITKNGATDNASLGGNTFLGVTSITNSGTGKMFLGNSTGDTYGSATTPASITFNAGTSTLYAACAGNNYFYGNVTSNGTPTWEVGSAGGICNFAGPAAQTISGNALQFRKITINKSSSDVTLNNPVTVTSTGSLTLTSGKINTTVTNYLLIANNASVTGGSATSYISGPLQKTGMGNFTFPIGKNSLYMPVAVSTSDVSDIIQAEAFSAVPPDNLNFSSTFNGISSCQYWALNRIVGTTTPLTVTLIWDNTTCTPIVQDNMIPAMYTGNLWKNVSSGPAIYNPPNGSVTSQSLTSALGNFTLGMMLPCMSNPFLNDGTMNWVQKTRFDEFGNVISQTRQYSDNLGRNIQSQVRNVVENKVLATATLYDVLGRPVLNTLPAPISCTTCTSCFSYQTNFITNGSNTPYTYVDFDKPVLTLIAGSVNNPNPVGTSSGTIGWYYSANNTVESYVPQTSYPYSRVDYNDLGMSHVVRSSSPGEALRMGQHETALITLPILWELNHYLKLRPYYTPGITPTEYTFKGNKKISKDENGIETVSFYDSEGKLLATCLAGSVNGVNQNSISSSTYYDYSLNYISGTNFSITAAVSNIEIYLNGNSVPFYIGIAANAPSGTSAFTNGTSVYIRSASSFNITSGVNSFVANSESGISFTDYMDIHIPLGCTPPVIGTTGTQGVYLVTDLITGTPTTLSSPGYYRIQNIQSGAILSINYSFNYYNFTYYYYDDAGRLISTISPNAVNLSLSSQPTMSNTYEYNTLGWILAQTNPDEGRMEYVYEKDGKIRFSQNALQKINNKFSYTNYNSIRQLTEVGEYLSDASGGALYFQNMKDNYNSVSIPTGYVNIFSLLGNTDGIDDGRCKQVSYSEYDSPDAGLSSLISGYTQRFVNSNVSKTYKRAIGTDVNNISTTWYSYDELGRIEWSIQNINGLGIKSIDYVYDILGNVSNVIYQKNTSTERFEHVYTYDLMKRLQKLSTRRLSGDALKQHAKYIYYLHGPLKRTEIENQLQGIDYTYAINGWLKAINHPNLDNKDPGGDGYTGSNSAFSKDIFGMSLEYYDNDYVNGTIFSTTSNLSSYVPFYNGNIRSATWNTNTGTVGAAVQYAYKYDSKYQLTQADFGTHDASLNQFTIASDSKYKVYGMAYDLNGNLATLQRNDQTGSLLSKNNIKYSIISNRNQLQNTQINDGTNTINRIFTYDAIGQMVSSTSTESLETNKYVDYDVYGKVTTVYANSAKTQIRVSYLYDESGIRIMKTTYNASYSPVAQTWYSHNANGSLMSIYITDLTVTPSVTSQSELPIYGTGKIGTAFINTTSVEYDYELTDYLGNVRAIIRRNSATQAFELSQYSDYYPHGSLMPGRYTVNTPGYRNGYQGDCAEVDPETGWHAFELRMYDSNLGRWFAPDPYGQHHSPYLGMGNNPVSGTDPNGGIDDIDINSKTNTATVTLKDGPHRVIVDGKVVHTFEGGYNSKTVFNEFNVAVDFRINGVSYKLYQSVPSAWSKMIEWGIDFEKNSGTEAEGGAHGKEVPVKDNGMGKTQDYDPMDGWLEPDTHKPSPGDSGVYYDAVTGQNKIGVKLKPNGGISLVGSRPVKNKADSLKYDIK